MIEFIMTHFSLPQFQDMNARPEDWQRQSDTPLEKQARERRQKLDKEKDNFILQLMS